MKKILFTLLAFFSISAYADADWLSPAGMTKVMEGVDDGTFHVSLGHTFPYYGGVFTDAWMSSNGVILLYDPTTQFGNPDTYNSMCCNGVDLTAGNTWGNFSFMLAPLWTDLRDANLTPDDGYYYETGQGGSSFLWYNVTEYATSNLNTFQANLWPDGSFDFLYDEVDVVQHQTFIGFSGDTSLGDATKLYYGNNISDSNLGGMNWWSQLFSGQGYAWYGQDGGYESSLDCSNALNDSRCPGYEEAYFNQQCSIDALYSIQCTGYEAAYFTQQCDYDPFYDTQCPGYDQALLLQDAAGTDFVYGDDISDFYETEITETFVASYNEEIDYGYEEEEYGGYTETYQSEEPAGFEEYEEETFNDTGPLYSEELGEVYTEPVAETEETISDESTLLEEEEMGADTISEDIALEEEYVEESEEITHIEEDMSNIEEDLLISEEAVATEGPKIDAVSIALTTAENAEMAAVSLATESTSQSVVNTQAATSNEATAVQQDIIQEIVAQDVQVAESVISVAIEQESTDTATESTQNEVQQEFSFGSVDAIFESVTLDMIVDPTITVAEVSVAVESPIEQATQEELTVDFQMESSTPTTDSGFSAQQDQSFSTGQSITAVLNNVAPNFSQFDVAPPSQQEQQTTQKAAAQANNMSEEQLASNLEEFANDMKDSGGFGDQSLTVFLMGRNSNFAQYNNVQLRDNAFYNDRGLPANRVQNDRNSMLQLIGTSGKHEEMISGQYR